MQLKRYEVASVSDALIKIKNDLGPDAIIVSTKQLKGTKHPLFEVMAARDEKVVLSENDYVTRSFPGGKNQSLTRQDDIFTFFRGEINDLKEAVRRNQKDNSLRRELEEIKETMDKFFDVLGMRKGRLNNDLNEKVYLNLLSSGFSRSSACKILEALNKKLSAQAQLNEETALKVVEEFIIKSIPVRQELKIEKRIKAFVGPTGVGKTTTLAKIAARYSLKSKKSVGFISTDTFRIAATEQLSTYAKIMDIKMSVASSKESFQSALHKFSDKEIILVDTPGRGRIDDGYTNLLRNILHNDDVETNLLINATASEDNMHDIISRYSTFGFDNLIVTKIDESRRFGQLYDVIDNTKKPITYWTCGQNVPQDIEEVTPQTLVNLIMGNADYCNN
jgi:flagellar biosynthesis protein FlhF